LAYSVTISEIPCQLQRLKLSLEL